ncbi:heparinase II/III domain-containing protein [Mucisphaera calidilacus]|uniref:Heparinase II/III-like protein n=1 Tax=Mucisphaera calidilacus TaxID=2527982 RepID=A0A518C1C5_9BACT|nr:heparinase II/III family protein [Mucisphaera calidilacus]QDU73018.1 Heparinase II/III-like protein [Mucisphaera calidilacus]
MTHLITALCLTLIALMAPTAAADDMSHDQTLIRYMNREHPRLFLQPDTWKTIRAKRATDPHFNALVTRLEHNAGDLLDKPPVVYHKKGRRLLSVSREALRRILVLAFTYHTTGEKPYLHRAADEIQQVIGFTDWNPSHYLDVAEMAAAVAIGYDWLYHDLDPQLRADIQQALWDHALSHIDDPKRERELAWMRSTHNWNQVCFGGLTLAMLVTAEQHPQRAARWLDKVRQGNPLALHAYAPDGVYPEGPSYWVYGTSYQVMLLDALNTALGSDLLLSHAPGFLESADYIAHVIGPTGLPFNYSDGDEKDQQKSALFWFAAHLNRPDIIANERARDWNAMTGSIDRITPLAAVWWARLDDNNEPTPPQPTVWYGQGEQPLAIFRSAWNDPNAHFLATKGGRASLNHGQMDAGSFVLDAAGHRWASDLGKQNYHSLESRGINLWGRQQDSQRWEIYRLNHQSHNTITINDQPHRVDGQATLVTTPDQNLPARAVYDLTPVFGDQATSVTRAFTFTPDNNILIEDQLEGLQPGDRVRWAMMTPATITLHGTTATLRQQQQTLRATVDATPAADFSTLEATPTNDFDAPNPGHRLLIVNATAPDSGSVRIAVTLEPPTIP